MMQKEPEIIEDLHEMVDMENGSALCADENSAEKTEEDDILSEDGVPVENGLTSTYEHDLPRFISSSCRALQPQSKSCS